MITKPERNAIVILLITIAAIATLYIGTIYFLPDRGAVEYSDDLQEGTLVKLEGIVYEVHPTNTGGSLILNVSGVTVYVPGGGTELYIIDGDYVSVIGKISYYAGKKEIKVDKVSDITIHNSVNK